VVVLRAITKLHSDTRGDAVVEAAILFPFIIMVFAGLVLLSMYLPIQASLQRSTQYAATALATEKSDTWLFFDENKMDYYWIQSKDQLPSANRNVYKALFNNNVDKATTIVEKMESNRIGVKTGTLDVKVGVVNYVVYKEIVVTATHTIDVTRIVDLSFVRFPPVFEIVVTSTAVVQNVDEFIRNIDLAVDFVEYAAEKFGFKNFSVNNMFKFPGSDKVKSILGW